nr:Gag-Pol polyprotein [Tanacetum cinerariifolium]
MHTFYERNPSEHRWTKDHPLEQVIGNPSQSIRIRHQLESDGEMCMFALTVNRTKLKNIKEAMANSAWIESMQEELLQFDRLDHAMAIASAQKNRGTLAALSIVRATSTSVRFRFLTTPFCSGASAEDTTEDLDTTLKDPLSNSSKALVDKLKGEIEDFKTKNKSLESSNNHFKEANNELSKTNQLMFKDLKKFQAELDRYHDVKYASKVGIDCAKAKGDLMSYKIVYEKINADLEKFHLCLKEEMVTDLRYFNSLELEVDSLKSQLETQKTQFLNEIDRLSREYYYADHMNAILARRDNASRTANILEPMTP